MTIGAILILAGIVLIAAGLMLPVAYAFKMRASARPSTRPLYPATERAGI